MKVIKKYVKNLILIYSQNIYKKLNLYFLILLVISLPLSEFTLSVSIIALTINYILSPNLKNRLKKIYYRKSVLAILIVYFLHIIGLLYSSNLNYGLHDLKIKITLPILAIILGTSEFPDEKEIKIIMQFFIFSLLVSSLISFLIYIGIIKRNINDYREISIYISHIRFSLLINVGIFYILYLFSKNEIPKPKIFYILSVIWLIVFLFMLKSLTGIVVFILLSIVNLIYYVYSTKKTSLIYLTIFFLTTILFLTVLYIIRGIKNFYIINEKNDNALEELTLNGNKYFHDTLNKDTENGYYIWRYICDKELSTEWQKRSSLPYWGKDLKNQELRTTLIRYLTSKGLRKDSVGLSQLSDQDIKNIENGIANYIYTKRFSIYPKIYEFLWEIEAMKKGVNPGGHSILQRIEYLKTAFSIISKNILFGVGTGDVDDAFKLEYKLSRSKLEPQWQHRTHNQFITFIVTFGIIGFIIIISCFTYAIIYEKKYKDFLFIVFLLIAIISMLNEDTLETHTGMSFFAFFLSLFLYRKNMKNEKT